MMKNVILIVFLAISTCVLADDTLTLKRNNVRFRSFVKKVKYKEFSGYQYWFGADFHLYETDTLSLFLKNTSFDLNTDSVAYEFFVFDSSKRKMVLLNGNVKIDIEKIISFTGINFEKMTRGNDVSIFLRLNNIDNRRICFVFKM